MKLSGGIACFLLLSTVEMAQACDILYDPKPSWEEMVEEADIVFVGRVISTSLADEQAPAGRALFEVEMPVKGEVGSQFDFVMGTSSCDQSFGVGDYVIFAGVILGDDASSVWARTSGWDPTVFLSEPLTPKQQSQLEYLKVVAKVR